MANIDAEEPANRISFYKSATVYKALIFFFLSILGKPLRGKIPVWHTKNGFWNWKHWVVLPEHPTTASDDKFWNIFMGEVQGKVFAGSFDGKSVLDIDALLS